MRVTICGTGCLGNTIAEDLQVQNKALPSDYTSPGAFVENNTVDRSLESWDTSAATVSGSTVRGTTMTK